MNKEELIKATQILQKHVPNRFPLKNAYIEAMKEYAEWYSIGSFRVSIAPMCRENGAKETNRV